MNTIWNLMDRRLRIWTIRHNLLEVFAGFVILLGLTAFPQGKTQANQVPSQENYSQIYDLSQFKGKLLVINFWASWCPPCQQETPDMVRMYARYHHQISFVGVNLTGSDTMQGIQRFLQQYHVPYPTLLDVNNDVAQRYGIVAVPTTLLIDRRGIIKQRIVGALTPTAIEHVFSTFLSSSLTR